MRLVIDMPMPNKCGNCPISHDGAYCGVTDESISLYSGKRPSSCPIKGEWEAFKTRLLNGKMKVYCESVDCTYNKDRECIRKEVEIDRFGKCDDYVEGELDDD